MWICVLEAGSYVCPSSPRALCPPLPPPLPAGPGCPRAIPGLHGGGPVSFGPPVRPAGPEGHSEARGCGGGGAAAAPGHGVLDGDRGLRTSGGRGGPGGESYLATAESGATVYVGGVRPKAVEERFPCLPAGAAAEPCL